MYKGKIKYTCSSLLVLPRSTNITLVHSVMFFNIRMNGLAFFDIFKILIVFIEQNTIICCLFV